MPVNSVSYRSVLTTREHESQAAAVEPALVPPPPGYDCIATVHAGPTFAVDELRCQNSGRRLARKRLRAACREDSGARERLETESRVGTRMRSRYVVQVFESVLDGPDPYVVSEWLPGETLQCLLQRRPRLPIRLCTWLARQCVQGLQHLERAGFSHGNLRASNLLVGPAGGVKLIGLSSSRAAHALLHRDPCQTASDELFAPPEAYEKPSEPRAADAYCLGALLYRMLTGRWPFEAHSTEECVRLQQEGDAPMLSRWRADAPRELAYLTQRLLAREPSERPESFAAIHRALVSLELEQLSDPFWHRAA